MLFCSQQLPHWNEFNRDTQHRHFEKNYKHSLTGRPANRFIDFYFILRLHYCYTIHVAASENIVIRLAENRRGETNVPNMSHEFMETKAAADRENESVCA